MLPYDQASQIASAEEARLNAFPWRNYVPVKTKISSQLRKSIALFESGGGGGAVPNGVGPENRSDLNSSGSSAEITDKQNQPIVRQRDSFEHYQPVSDRSTTGESTDPTQLRQTSPPKQSDVGQSQSITSHPDATDPSDTQLPRNVDMKKNDHDYEYLSDLEVSSAQNRLSSWQASTALDRIESTNAEPSALQDFILQSDAFRVSPQFMDSTNLEDSLPTLQHAEPIAVATPDEDEDEESEPD
ncbi:unnamed protein product, partial [Echinostoma caproni]|uniref:Bestrophin homolog n=1 Tax=Echinostoma caproni TaxID=27848 RepID=A0A183APF7_9TREM